MHVFLGNRGALAARLSVAGLALAALCASCRSAGGPDVAPQVTERGVVPRSAPEQIRRVICLYRTNPWVDADKFGDRDPEGIQYYVYLSTTSDPQEGRGEWRAGMFHVELYVLERQPDGTITRTLGSDWHYPTDQFTKVKSKYLGEGYHLRLVWAHKAIAGSEIELLTAFEDEYGRKARSETKRLRVPDYDR